MPAPSRTASRLFVVALAHLDTQWRWTVRRTIRDFLPATVEANDRLFERYPRYLLSFEGAFRYRLLAEYHPALFERVRQLVADGRWYPAGAAVEAFDANLPSPESIVRQILYGNRYFARDLGVRSRDLFLPDCFGFPWSLPTVAAHAGIVGFSTQKLERGTLMRSAYGIPFEFGRWRGPDGAEILAALRPGEYSGHVDGDLSRDPVWIERFAALAAQNRPPRAMLYAGTGDKGGAPPAESIQWIERSLDGGGPIGVENGPSEAIFVSLEATDRERLPLYDGELLLRLHGTGCYSAKAAVKRANAGNESLAQAAEALSVAAAWLSGEPYPHAAFEEAWWRILAHQMHDDLTGTSIPAAYRITAEDQAIAANELSERLLDAVTTIAGVLDTEGEGAPIVVFNTVARPRVELVEIEIGGSSEDAPRSAVSSDGTWTPLQFVADGSTRRALFPAAIPELGAAVVHLVESASPAAVPALAVSERLLENERLRARFDGTGDLASLYDKRLDRELLARPRRLELLPDRSNKYPAWEIRWSDASAPPIDVVERIDSIRIVERGPWRAAIEIARECRGSRFVETYRLAAGDAVLEVEIRVDWRTTGALLKSTFPFAMAAQEAIYDLGVGRIRRPLASLQLYEVPAHDWVALEDPEGRFAVVVASAEARGWDLPARGVLRATLLHSPATWRRFRHQARQDFGHHRFRFAIGARANGVGASPASSGAGDEATPLELRLAERFRQPLLAYRSEPHPGKRGRAFSYLSLSPSHSRLLALKGSEGGDGFIVRVAESVGRPANVRIDLPAPIERAEALDGQERILGRLAASGASAEVPVRSFGLVSIGFHLAPATPRIAPRLEALPLPLDSPATTSQKEQGRGFDDRGTSFPRELAPGSIGGFGWSFDLAHWSATDAGAVASRGQEIALPEGFERLWLLAASIDGDREFALRVGGELRRIVVHDWRRPLGRFDEVRPRWKLGARVAPGWLRRVPLAWTATHLHDGRGRDLVYEQGFLFRYCVPIGTAAGSLRLPADPALRIAAATLSRGAPTSVRDGQTLRAREL